MIQSNCFIPDRLTRGPNCSRLEPALVLESWRAGDDANEIAPHASDLTWTVMIEGQPVALASQKTTKLVSLSTRTNPRARHHHRRHGRLLPTNASAADCSSLAARPLPPIPTATASFSRLESRDPRQFSPRPWEYYRMKGTWKQSGMATMANHVGHLGVGGGGGSLVGPARRARLCVYGFALVFAVFAGFLAFAPSLSAPSPSSPAAAWFDGFLASASPYRAQVSSFFSSLFPTNSSSPEPPGGIATKRRGPSVGGFAANGGQAGSNDSSTAGAGEPSGSPVGVSSSNAGGSPSGNSPSGNATAPAAMQSSAPPNDQAGDGATRRAVGGVAFPTGGSAQNGTTTKYGVPLRINGTSVIASSSEARDSNAVKAKTRYAAGSTHQLGGAIAASSNGTTVPFVNQTGNAVAEVIRDGDGATSQRKATPDKNQTVLNPPALNNQNQSRSRAASGGSNSTIDATPSHQESASMKKVHWIEAMESCDMFYGNWVRDDSYPLYPEGSCPHIDESFNCPLNGRPDNAYQRLRWQPSVCNIPRLNPTDMLERLRGKRLVFVGDSLNRNMWESLVCILRNSVKDKRRVFEVSGRHEFRAEGSYSFLFQDYNCSVEFFRSPFLVQEWEVPVRKGKTKETLRLDMISRLFPRYKDADIIIFNTGHWWTHEKTSLGKDYYQEGNRVYSELNVHDAFQRALNTWAKWVDSSVNPKKTTVFFRGYSASHFSGGQWNSGGSCDKETEPIINEKYLTPYPQKMSILEEVLRGMKTPVVYLNITRMTDYRKEAHPSVYRKQKLTEEELKSPEIYQDCSHWCLPGVPDSWNELLYAQILVKQHQILHHQ
ncbi:hypothetical protein GUJ93_ZPchr0006g45669 [Zizania palustris]|uniref:Trichome birefringence-like N-terminal domain-containing protein n=1 Tax=Zizania palustris TaxID=103762 RepID=A0A8J5SMM8_ZIZPA|nr:hypothetical protein GUJ93_ZPchr0006g45669 [Zizania palustris]